MALIRCTECKTAVSDKASACPRCGCPIEVRVQDRLPDEAPTIVDMRTIESEQVPPTRRPESTPSQSAREAIVPAQVAHAPVRPQVPVATVPTNVVVQVASAPQHDASGELVFYQSGAAGGIRITNTRAVIGPTLYSMANITSVGCFEQAKNYGPPIYLMLFGALILIAGLALGFTAAMVTGTIMFALGLVWLFLIPTWYVLKIQSSSGVAAEHLRSKNKHYIDEIVRAFHDAIVHRG